MRPAAGREMSISPEPRPIVIFSILSSPPLAKKLENLASPSLWAQAEPWLIYVYQKFTF
jgi:hypothetical protein